MTTKGSSMRSLFVALVATMLASCTGLRYSSEEDPLYTGSTLDWKEIPAYDPKGVEAELLGLVEPEANNSILGLRPTVALHNSVKEPEQKKGFRFWLKYKVGNPPTYLSQLPLADINAAMINRLQNRGFFGAQCGYEVKRSKRKASVVFSVNPGKPHVIKELRMGQPNGDPLDTTIAAMTAQCRIKPGEPYDLTRLTGERSRIADRLRDLGWYRIRADDLVWAADTTVGNRQVLLHLLVKSNTGAAKRLIHTIGSVTVHADQDDVLPPVDSSNVSGVQFINYLGMYRPSPLLRGVFVLPGDTFSLSRSNATQQYLTSYGVFKNVVVAYADDTARNEVLHARIALMPMKRFSIFSELNAVSKSNNFAGPGIRVGFLDRNLLGGAEQLTLDVNGRFETQVAGADKGTNAYEIGVKAGLAIPRMLLLPESRALRYRAPVTNIGLGFGLFRRINLYGISTVAAGLGYSWRRDRTAWHDLQLLEISLNDLFYTTDDFNDFLEENPTIKRSLEDQFVVGIGYTYTRSTRKRDTQRNWFVYSLGLDESGNLLSAIFAGTRGSRPEEGYTLFDQRYSQYLRLRPEMRWYMNLGSHGSQLVTRLLTHAGISYGNTDVMPYVKQFYSGGTNSLRGFRARSVGPGSYVSQVQDNVLVDQVGDLKLEFNMEYRFTLSGYVKGAVFADAGNVWLLRDDPSRPGGKFELDTFVSEIGFDAGLGLRFDPQVIVIRLDLAAPLRRPDLPAGERWVTNNIDEKWKNNLILNIAIGYPF